MERKLVRIVDELGRVVLPREFRQALHWESGTQVEVTLTEDAIILKLYAGQEKASPDCPQCKK